MPTTRRHASITYANSAYPHATINRRHQTSFEFVHRTSAHSSSFCRSSSDTRACSCSACTSAKMDMCVLSVSASAVGFMMTQKRVYIILDKENVGVPETHGVPLTKFVQ